MNGPFATPGLKEPDNDVASAAGMYKIVGVVQVVTCVAVAGSPHPGERQ
jgi:hypothetical protein